MKKYLARNHKFYINNSNNWIPISGISNWSLAYTSETSDVSKFNSNGWYGSIITSRSGTITLEGFYLADSNGNRDQGQLLCDQSISQLGYHGTRGFKIEAYDDVNQSVVGYILFSGVLNPGARAGKLSSAFPWGATISLKGMPMGSGIYNIFSQESYPVTPPDTLSRSGMWTGVLGMYTYAE